MSKTPQLPRLLSPQQRGMGKVEFLACLPEIQTMLEKGYSISMVYAALKTTDKITIGYSQFWRFLKGSGKPASAPLSALPASPTSPPSRLKKSALALTAKPETPSELPALLTSNVANDYGDPKVPNLPHLPVVSQDFLPSNFFAESKEPS